MSLARLDAIAGDVLDVLWRASWQAAVLAVMVLIVQWLLRGRLSARWRYNLWLLVLLRLVVPVTPQSSLSVFNLSNRFVDAPRATVATNAIAPSSVGVSRSLETADSWDATRIAPTAALAKPQAAVGVDATARAAIPWRLILACAWITGTLILVARIAYATIRLNRAVRRMTIVDAPHVLDMLERCRDELAIRRRIKVLACDDLPAPALMGVIRPRLLLPRDVLAPDKFAPDELRLILLHELGHLRRTTCWSTGSSRCCTRCTGSTRSCGSRSPGCAPTASWRPTSWCWPAPAATPNDPPTAKR